jgi:hypothetical protein
MYHYADGEEADRVPEADAAPLVGAQLVRALTALGAEYGITPLAALDAAWPGRTWHPYLEPAFLQPGAAAQLNTVDAAALQELGGAYAILQSRGGRNITRVITFAMESPANAATVMAGAPPAAAAAAQRLFKFLASATERGQLLADAVGALRSYLAQHAVVAADYAAAATAMWPDWKSFSPAGGVVGAVPLPPLTLSLVIDSYYNRIDNTDKRMLVAAGLHLLAYRGGDAGRVLLLLENGYALSDVLGPFPPAAADAASLCVAMMQSALGPGFSSDDSMGMVKRVQITMNAIVPDYKSWPTAAEALFPSYKEACTMYAHPPLPPRHVLDVLQGLSHDEARELGAAMVMARNRHGRYQAHFVRAALLDDDSREDAFSGAPFGAVVVLDRLLALVERFVNPPWAAYAGRGAMGALTISDAMTDIAVGLCNNDFHGKRPIFEAERKAVATSIWPEWESWDEHASADGVVRRAMPKAPALQAHL